MATPNLNLPTAPAGATNISAPYNSAMQALDALCQIGVEEVLNTPPVTTLADLGKMWIVGDTPTGDFIGHEEDLALCTGENLFVFYDAGTQVKYYLNKSDNGFYMYNAGWVLAGGLADAPSDGTTYGRKDGAWADTAGVPPDADVIDYDNVASGLVASNVQDAIDELAALAAFPPVATPSSTAGALTLDFDTARNFVVTLTENVTVTVTNWPATGYAAEIDVTFIQDATGGRTVTLPAAFKALGGSDTAVAAGANAVTELVAKTKDGGTTVRYAMQESA